MSARGLVAAVVGLLALWALAAALVQQSVLPGPDQVAVTLVRELGRGLGGHFLVSAGRVGAAMLLAGLTAAPLGLLLGQSPRLDRLAAPAIYLTYPIPKIVLLPILMLFLGFGDLTKVFIIWLILFFQVLVVVRDAAGAVRSELVQSVRSLGAGRWGLLRFVYGPACLPAVLTALRVSTGTAIAVLFLTESFATRTGLGYYILVEGWGRLAYTEMYAGVVAMSLLGLGVYVLLDRVEATACRWTRV